MKKIKIENYSDESAPLLNEDNFSESGEENWFGYIVLQRCGYVYVTLAHKTNYPYSFINGEELPIAKIPTDISGRAINQFLADPETQELIEQIHTGFDNEYNGQNFTYTLTEEAKESKESFQNSAESFFENRRLTIYSAQEWIENDDLDELWDESSDLDDLIDILKPNAKNEIYVDGSLEEAIREKLENMDEKSEKLLKKYKKYFEE